MVARRAKPLSAPKPAKPEARRHETPSRPQLPQVDRAATACPLSRRANRQLRRAATICCPRSMPGWRRRRSGWTTRPLAACKRGKLVPEARHRPARHDPVRGASRADLLHPVGTGLRVAAGSGDHRQGQADATKAGRSRSGTGSCGIRCRTGWKPAAAEAGGAAGDRRRICAMAGTAPITSIYGAGARRAVAARTGRISNRLATRKLAAKASNCSG